MSVLSPPSILSTPSVRPSEFSIVDVPLNVIPFTPLISEKNGNTVSATPNWPVIFTFDAVVVGILKIPCVDVLFLPLIFLTYEVRTKRFELFNLQL